MELKKREDIIKALECCYTLSSDCLSCPFIEDNRSCASISLMAFALIKELMQEIKDLEAEYDRVYEQAEADIRGNMADGGMSCHWCMDKTKADTAKRIQEKIDTNHRISTVHYVGHAEPTITYEFTNWELDQMIKEILEGKSNV